jgi:galactokinase
MTTGESLARALIERGIEAAELAAKASLFDRALRTFHGVTRCDPQHAWWVPGRLEVFGKHTDYAGGRTLVCTVPRGFIVLASPRGDGVLRVADAGRDERFSLDPSDETVHTGWRHYVEVVARRFAHNFPGAVLGADITIASDLPRASGMSSSSALVVGIATALVRIGGLERRVEWRANLRSPIDAAGYFACLENGLSFGTLAGDTGVGTHGGSEDHAAIVTGVPRHLSAFGFVPMRHLHDVRVPVAWQFVLTPSGVASAKTGSAMERYNRLSQGARLLLALWNESGPAADSLGSALGASPENADRLRDLIRRSRNGGWPPDALERRLDHFIREDARVDDAVHAVRAGDADRVGTLADGSQSDAETLLGNQIPETTALARSARELGAFASCSFGAGFGGSVWSLVDAASADDFARRWHPHAFVATPSPALSELSSGAQIS